MSKQIVGKISKSFSPKEYEEEILEWWKKEKIYDRIKRLNKGGKKFYFLDGPPYVTNPPHVGTAWNKILKDVVIRFKRMRGFKVRDQPGYDCHGLPIEVKVEEELGIKTKKEIEEKISVQTFIKRCKEYAEENAKIQTEVFKNLGVWMNWNNPYLTLKNDYIESVWWTIKKAYEKNLLKKDLKVVHWCPRCETALSGYEVTDEYRYVKDYSVYVKFPLENEVNKFILIWTTTPWTLPANVAVMIHPEEYYVEAKSGDETYILAENRCEPVFNEVGKQFEIIKRVKGKELLGLKYKPPLLEEAPLQAQIKNAHIVITSEKYVSMNEGTGCVHCAPGHGEEDFEVGLEYSLPVVSPVDASGKFTQDAGKYAGKYIKEADQLIINDLKNKKLLFHVTTIEHAYPHCWRCKTPLILRATEQWFIKVSEYKNKLIEENENVTWIPEWAGKRRFKDWLLGARDWVISRQRFWGIPIPIWVCEKCKKEEVVGSISELKSKALNFPKKIDLHRDCVDEIYLRCSCNGKMKRIPDILDVWMDSGTASWASLNYPKKKDEFEKWWPADIVIEAHDQTRGWFYTQLCASILAFDKSPYKAVLMHGHALDASGQKMSKSLGNFISPEDVITKYGRDALRLYELQNTTWEDFKFSWIEVEECWRNLHIIWNVYAFASIYMNLDKFQPSKWSVKRLYKYMRNEDKWLLSKTESLKVKVTEFLERFEVHSAIKELLNYAVEDLSRWYIKLVRRRFWQEKESLDKLAAYATLYYALKNWLILIAPFLPFISEKLYREIMFPAEGKRISIHMWKWPKIEEKLINKDYEEQMDIVKKVVEAALSARQTLKIKLRQPVKRVMIVTGNLHVKNSLINFKDVILEQVNTKTMEFIPLDDEEKLRRIFALPKLDVLGPIFKSKTTQIIERIKNENGWNILKSFREKGFFEVSLNEEKIKITPEMVTFKEELEGFAVGEFANGRIYIDGELTEELILEGLTRDIIRRIQEMRGEIDLPVDAFITVYIKCPSTKEEKIKTQKNYIKEEVRAKEVIFEIPKDQKFNLKKQWIIDEETFEIAIKTESIQ
ncbi:MAG: isoleucine--tRNA ligase [Candidatus Bathyarchaeia archaeon]